MKTIHAVTAAIALFAVAAPVRAELLNDEKLGYSIQTPKGWKRVAMAVDEQWVIGKYVCDREYVGKKERVSHTPEMQVILFPHQAARGPAVDVQKDEGTTTIRIRRNFKDWKDYLTQTAAGGWFVASETETTVNGVKTTCIEVKFEKLTTPRRIVCWVFHGSDADYAVQFDGLEDYWDSLSKEFTASLKSFKLFQRKGSLPTSTGETGPTIEIDDPGKKVAPEDRAKKRDDKFQATLRKVTEGLPPGWSQKKTKNFIAVSHVDDKYTQKVLDQAEAVRGWLDQSLAWIGEGKPGPLIIRICENFAEEQAFRTGTATGWFDGGFEVTTHKDVSSGKQSYEFEWLNQRVMGAWLSEKNRRLSGEMPEWLQAGLQRFVGSAIMKAGKIDFRPPEYEMYRLRDAKKSGKIATFRGMVLSDREKLGNLENPQTQAAQVVRYLLDGPGAKAPRTKDVFKSYLKNLQEFCRGQDEKDSSGAGARGTPGEAPATEEQEEEAFKKRQQMWKQKEKEVLDAVFQKTFSAWTEADWKALEASYAQFLD